MFKYVRYTPFTDQYTTYDFIEKDEKCKIHRFDVPYVSVECSTDADFAALMAAQNPSIEAIEITQEEFSDMVQHSIQVKRIYDVANEQFKKECEAITRKYTPEEVSTWGIQVNEAESIKNGLTIATPFLSALSEDEGITLSAAADKILGLRDMQSVYTADCLKRKWQKISALKAEVGL